MKAILLTAATLLTGQALHLQSTNNQDAFLPVASREDAR